MGLPALVDLAVALREPGLTQKASGRNGRSLQRFSGSVWTTLGFVLQIAHLLWITPAVMAKR